MLSSACIIPVLGGADALEATLLSVLEQKPDDCEVIVVLNVPYDDPFGLSNEHRFIHAAPEADLIGCVNLGIAAATAPIVHVLASGLEADDGWLQCATERFADSKVAAVTPVIYDRTQRECVVAAGVGYGRGGRRIICRTLADSSPSAAGNSVGPLLVAGSFRKESLAPLGGGIPSAVGDGLADIDLALSLRRAGWSIVLDSSCRVFGDAVAEPSPGGFRFGIGSERLFWRQARHFGLLRELLGHPAHAASACLRSSPRWLAPAQALGRLIGLCQFGHYAAYRQQITAARKHFDAFQASLPDATVKESATAANEGSKRVHRVDKPHPSGRRSEAALPAPAQSARRRGNRA